MNYKKMFFSKEKTKNILCALNLFTKTVNTSDYLNKYFNVPFL